MHNEAVRLKEETAKAECILYYKWQVLYVLIRNPDKLTHIYVSSRFNYLKHFQTTLISTIGFIILEEFLKYGAVNIFLNDTSDVIRQI